MKKIALIALSFIFSINAHSAIIATDMTDVTTTGQSYGASITVSDSYTNVFLDIVIKGDYTVAASNETFSFFLDGVQMALWDSTTPGLDVVNNYGMIDYTISGVVGISDALWASLAGDGTINVTWINGSGVNATTLGGADFVSYTINGDENSSSELDIAISEPFAGSFISIALALMVFRRKRK